MLRATDRLEGVVEVLQQRKFAPGFVTGLKWFPQDNGMFSVAYNNRVLLVDSNAFAACETHAFGQQQLFWCDWSVHRSKLIAVAASASTVRFIDVRSGGSLHSLTLASPLAVKDHSVTRVLWDRSDADVLFAGDSSGCLHVYDIRAPRKAVQVVSPDSHALQTVTCLQPTPCAMNLLSSHGLHSHFSLWTFRSKKLVRTSVHFEMPIRRRQKQGLNVSGLVRTQVFMTCGLLFSPVAEGTGDVYVHDLRSGARLRSLDSNVYSANVGRKVNAVAGCGADAAILYSAGKSGIRVWCPRFASETQSNPLHKDDWSDDE